MHAPHANTTAAEAAVERDLLENSLRQLLERHWAPARRQDLTPVWRALVEAGFTDMASRHELQTWSHVFHALAQLGRAGCPAPLLAAAIAATLLPPGWVATDQPLALAFTGPAADTDDVPFTWQNGHASGRIPFVEGASRAGAILIFHQDGRAPEKSVCLAFDPGAVEIVETPVLAQPGHTELRFTNAPARAHSLSPEDWALGRRLFQLGSLARALGAARRGVDLAVEHARVRHQFGQPIGRFQAVQHKLATCAILLDACGLQIDEAVDALVRGHSSSARLTTLATAFVGPTLRQVALETQHMLGAIGYAEEHEAPHLFRLIHQDVMGPGATLSIRRELAALLLNEAPTEERPEPEDIRRFRLEVRDWLDRNWTEADRAANRQRPFSDRIWNIDFARRMGRDGWTRLNWPRHADGQDRSAMEQLVFVEEMQRAGAPDLSTIVSCRIVGPELIEFGSPELKAELLPGVSDGSISFCLGYSEPEAGSDLASLRTRAVRQGESYVINGQKIWTSDGHRASHMILAARTDPDPARRHAGISLFLISMDTPGIEVRPSMAFYGHPFCNVFFDNVVVPATARLGPENGGWPILARALASERIIMGAYATQLERLFEALIAHLRDTPRGADPVVRDRIAQLAAEVHAARLLALRSIRMSDSDEAPLVEAAMSKVFSSELGERLTEAAIDILGPAALLSDGPGNPPLGGRIEELLRRSIMMVIGGGTNEIQRSLIAQRGLRLPR